MNKKLNNLNEQLSRMKKLMTFEMGDHSHETLSNNLIKEQEEKTGGGVQLYVVGKDGQRDIKIGVKGNEIYAVGIDDSLGKKIGGGDLNTLKSNFKSKDQTYMDGLQYVLSKSPNGIISGELYIPGADVYFQNSGSFTTQGVGFFIEDGKPRMVGFDFAKTNELKSGIIKPIKASALPPTKQPKQKWFCVMGSGCSLHDITSPPPSYKKNPNSSDGGYDTQEECMKNCGTTPPELKLDLKDMFHYDCPGMAGCGSKGGGSNSDPLRDPKNVQKIINFGNVLNQKYTEGKPIYVLGFASEEGDVNHNLELSQKRADYVANLLRSKITNKNIKIIPQGKGETTRFKSGTDETSYKENRRIIVTLDPNSNEPYVFKMKQ
jgi:hypothetical protein